MYSRSIAQTAHSFRSSLTFFSLNCLNNIFCLCFRAHCHSAEPGGIQQAGHLQLPRLNINHLSFVFAPYYITAESRSWSNGWDSSNEPQMVIFIILTVPRNSPLQEGEGDSEHSRETFSDTKSHFCLGSSASQWISGCWSQSKLIWASHYIEASERDDQELRAVEICYDIWRPLLATQCQSESQLHCRMF